MTTIEWYQTGKPRMAVAAGETAIVAGCEDKGRCGQG